MADSTKLSHAVQRRLTQAWEVDRPGRSRSLLTFEFATGGFAFSPSKRALTATSAFGDDVEEFLNQTYERRIGLHLERLERLGLQAPPVEEVSALLLSIFFQGTRSAAGREDADSRNLLRRATQWTDEELRAVTQGLLDEWAVIGGVLPADVGELCFPSAGLAAVPLVGGVGFFQPTTPQTFTACIPRRLPFDVARQTVEGYMRAGTLSAFSVGLTCARVVVPPSWHDVDRSDLATTLHEFRQSAVRLVECIAEMAWIAGL